MGDEMRGTTTSWSSRGRGASPAGIALCGATLVTLATLASACSFVAARPTPRTTRGGRLECTSYTVPALDLGLAAALGGGALMALTEDDCADCHDNIEAEMRGVVLSGVALVAIASSVYGFAAVDTCHRRKRALEAERERGATTARKETVIERREQKAAAWELTLRAKTAARGGDCATVATLDAQVRVLDPALHATVFIGDVAIASCLTPVPRAGP